MDMIRRFALFPQMHFGGMQQTSANTFPFQSSFYIAALELSLGSAENGVVAYTIDNSVLLVDCQPTHIFCVQVMILHAQQVLI